jgi:hypothetical protein
LRRFEWRVRKESGGDFDDELGGGASMGGENGKGTLGER